LLAQLTSDERITSTTVAFRGEGPSGSLNYKEQNMDAAICSNCAQASDCNENGVCAECAERIEYAASTDAGWYCSPGCPCNGDD